MRNFNEIMDSFGSKFESETIFNEAERQFSLRPFKLRKFSIKKAVINYNEIWKKYENKEIEQWSEQWHKNQRKLFIEFLICYCKINAITPQKMNDNAWTQLSCIFFDKNPMFLKFQGFSILKLAKKINWNKQDDKLVKECIKEYGEGNWNQISKQIFFKSNFQKFLSPKQIRQRWYNHLSEYVNRGKWELEEDFIILQHVLKSNKRWCEIVKLLDHRRTEHMIKNRYKFLVKQQINNRPSRQLRAVSIVLNKIKKKLEANGKSNTQDFKKLKNQKFPLTDQTIVDQIVSGNDEQKEVNQNFPTENDIKSQSIVSSQGHPDNRNYETVPSYNQFSPANFNFYVPICTNNSFIYGNYCIDTPTTMSQFSPSLVLSSPCIMPAGIAQMSQSSFSSSMNFWQPYINNSNSLQQISINHFPTKPN